MKSIIIGKKLKFGAGLTGTKTKDNIQELLPGAITVSRSDNSRLVSSTTNAAHKPFGANHNLAKDAKIQFIQGTLGDPILSPVINPFRLKYTKQVHTPSVAKVMSIGRNVATTVASWNLPSLTGRVGEYASIRIYDLDAAPGVTNNVAVAEYLIKEGDDATAVHNGLFAKLEKYKGKFYANVEKVVSTTNLGYKFTGILNKNFTVIPELLLAGSGVTTDTKIVYGLGLADVLVDIEKNYASRKGYNQTYTMREELYQGEFFIDPNTNYDIFVLEWTDPNRHYLAAGDDPFIQTLLIAVPTGDLYPDTSGELQKVLDSILDFGTDNTWGTVVAATTHTVTFTAGANGAITAVSNGTVLTSTDEVLEGSDVLFIATPANTYKVASWTVTEGTEDPVVYDEDPADTFLFEGLSEDITVAVAFESE